jgi:hypothetical protein
MMNTVDIACCGMFHRVNAIPWTCKTCGRTHLGAAPPTFPWQVQTEWERLRQQITTLQEEIVERKHAMRRLEQEQALLGQYLDFLDEQDGIAGEETP